MSRKKQTDKAPAEGPPDDFCDWWNPSGTHEPSGASVGGHPDAVRVWARKEPGKWLRRTYGIAASHAWLVQCYRGQYQEWLDAGSPTNLPHFVSLAEPMPEQTAFWKRLGASLKAIVKPMPKTPSEIRNPLTNRAAANGAIDFSREPVDE